jgi:hypothetical protein
LLSGVLFPFRRRIATIFGFFDVFFTLSYVLVSLWQGGRADTPGAK